jgi:uncharacterized membrane protein
VITVTLYTQNDEPQIEQIKADLESLQEVVPHQLVIINIDSEESLQKAYSKVTPLVKAGPYSLRLPFTKQDLEVTLRSAQERAKYYEEANDAEYQKRVDRGKNVSGADKFSYWFSKRYMLVLNAVVLIFVGLPFLAPVLMKQGLPGGARIIYTIYSPLCHQLSFRSFFLYGEQPYYPRELAGLENVITYEELTNSATIDVTAARKFIGNEVVGYKVAFCERDIAIYAGIFLFGLMFALSGRKIPGLKWYVWVIIGLVPIGLDGVSQLPSLAQNFFPGWMIIRESTPILRVITGLLFGISTAWFMYPMIEETMIETRNVLARKFEVVKQTQIHIKS